MASKKRQDAKNRGQRGEVIAAWLLRIKGYLIVAQSMRNSMGEIDIIAKRRHIMAFIEVKTRGTLDEALNAVSLTQRQRIERAAIGFMSGREDLSNLDMRFDVIAMLPKKWPCHLPQCMATLIINIII